MTRDTSHLKLSKQQLLSLYRQMLVIRRCEEQLARSYQAGLIHGACHTYVGQEAVAMGVCAHLRPDDAVFSTHRGHGHALAKGVSVRQVIAELFGRATGCSFGRGGSMHLFSPDVGLMGTSGIVGPCILQATGAGYTFKLLKTNRVGVAFFGDGAVNNGAFHEGLNMAAIWQLPTVFVCENNMYATEIPFAYATKNQNVAERAASYGLPGVVVDGNDVLAVYEAAGDSLSPMPDNDTSVAEAVTMWPEMRFLVNFPSFRPRGRSGNDLPASTTALRGRGAYRTTLDPDLGEYPTRGLGEELSGDRPGNRGLRNTIRGKQCRWMGRLLFYSVRERSLPGMPRSLQRRERGWSS
jgi:hypothetical protein